MRIGRWEMRVKTQKWRVVWRNKEKQRESENLIEESTCQREALVLCHSDIELILPK
jgi:hypothetical protein